MQAQGRTARRSRCRWVLISTDVRPPPLLTLSLALRATCFARSPVGFLAGISTLLSLGSCAPWIAFFLGSKKKSVCRALVAASLGAAVLSCSRRVFTLEAKNGVPYTAKAPKRMLVQHLKHVDGHGRVANKTISVVSLDAIPVSSPGILPRRLLDLESLEFDASDWVSFFPLNYLVTGMTFREVTDVETSVETSVEREIPSLSTAPWTYSVTDSVTRYVQDACSAAKTVLGITKVREGYDPVFWGVAPPPLTRATRFARSPTGTGQPSSADETSVLRAGHRATRLGGVY